MTRHKAAKEVTYHHVGAEHQIKIYSQGEANKGGAFNEYIVFDSKGDVMTNCLGMLRFQNGHPAVVGRNGVTLEALLSICLDRLHAFQHGPFANDYNASAMLNIERALEALKDRTREQEAA